ncbi:hypothetical protein K7432_001434 [Basidiobolus ranarum]|uniref:Bromo domain-containing protein n=1 Tax=Basidiobolus ranarum TaxID=34480 RepID=A0ABR2W9M3_9FUNG
MRTMMDPKCFYRIRMEGAFALAKCAIPQLDWIGLHHLFKIFQKRYCYASTTSDGDGEIAIVPKPNNFSVFTEYFVQKAIVAAFSTVKNSKGHTPIKIKQFLLELLRYNDNTGNHFSDNYYISALINALGNALIPNERSNQSEQEGEKELFADAVQEIERYRTLDYLVPSYHNTVTISVLQVMMKLMMANLLAPNLKLFLGYTRYGNFMRVRLVAFEALLLLDGLRNGSIGQYIFQVIALDPCHYVRYYLAKCLSEMLGVHIARASSTEHDTTEEMVFEEVGQPKVIPEKTSEEEFIHTPGLEAIHKEFSGREDLQAQVWEILTSNPEQDYRVFRYMFLFCELLYKPIDTIPKLKIKMPVVAPSESRIDTPLRTSSKTAEANKPTEKADPVTSIRKESTKASHDIPMISAQEDEDIEIEAGTVPSSTKPTSTTTSKEDKKTKVVSTPKNRKESKTSESRKESRDKDSERPYKSEPVVPDVLVKIEPDEVSTSTPVAATTPTHKAKLPSRQTPQPNLTIPVQDQLRPEEMKVCKRILRKMMAHKSAFYFLQPVDPIRDGCPTYFDLIKHPMDLGTVKLKLDEGNYHNLKEFEDDVRLMLNNCFVFNPVGSYVYNEGQELESVFEKEWSEQNAQKLVGREPEFNMTIVESPVTKSKPLPSEKSDVESEPPKNEVEKSSKNLTPELHKCRSILKRIAQHESAFEFLRPVDPIKQGIPTYFEMIKSPMDLGTVNKKLKSGQYQTKDDFREDVELMLNNCFTFNTPGTFVYDQAKSLSEVFQREWENQFGTRTVSDSVEPTHAPVKVEPISEPSVPIIPDSSRKPKMDIPEPATVVKIAKPSVEKDPKEVTSIGFTKPAPAIATPRPPSPMVRAQPPNSSRESSGIPTPKAATSVKNSRKSLTPKPSQSPVRSNASPVTKITGKATNAMDDVTYKRCQRILKKLWSNPSSEPFQLPVDPIALKIPTYTDIVKEPMDLKTVKEKLDRDDYISIRDFEKDIRQVFFNCFLFNQPGTWVFEEGKKMEAYFYELLDRDKPRRPILSEDKQNLLKLIQKMTKSKHSSLFREPVDWVTLQIPDYPRIIRQPMDLRTIKDKLENDQYRTWVDFERDIRLIFNNCFTFNPSGTYAHEECQHLENYFFERYQEIKSTLKVIPDVSRTPSREPSIKREPEPVSMTPEQLKLCEKIYKKVSGNKNAAAFLEPVDPVAMGIPHYFDVVRNPMDFSTVHKKLKAGEYSIPGEFEADVRQIFKNCATFNGPEHYYTQQAMLLDKILDKEMLAFQNPKYLGKQNGGSGSRKSSKQPKKETVVPMAAPIASPIQSSRVSVPSSPKTLDRSALKACESVLARIKSHPAFEPFRAPVDIKALGIPHYYKVVKHPMDFGTIENKLRSGKYQSIEQFVADSQLVFENCYAFNIPGDSVYVMGQELQRSFEKACKKYGLLDTIEKATPERSAVKRVHPEDSEQSERHGTHERKRKKDRKEKRKHKHSSHREDDDRPGTEEHFSDSENSRASASRTSPQPQVRLKIKLKH